MPSHSEFVHLHAHTEYSLLDGACRVADDKGKPSDLIKFVASRKMNALAMTDHGNLFGAIEFYQSCRNEGIKPILGMEAYVAPKSRADKTGSLSHSNNHLTLLAKNTKGYENLMKLSTLSYKEGFYYKPRIDGSLLEKYHEGIMALSGCLKSKVSETIMNQGTEQASKTAGEYEEIFGKGNFYLELMDHGIDDQRKVNKSLLEIHAKTGIPIVATNDCHYLKKEDSFAHDVLLCIGTGKLLSETNRMKYATGEFYYKTPEEMAKVFSELPEAVRNTKAVSDQCDIEIQFDKILLPKYQVPQGESLDSYLEKLCQDGIRKRYGQLTAQLKTRLDFELEVIKKMGFAAYFLIVWDFINFARRNHIPVGPGRGSGAGSLVSYALEITSINPMEYGLLFERFLNPERRTMPDLDIDFSDEGREKVIRYVKEKYGENSVAQIIAFGSMMARGVVRDVGRVLEIPLQECDRIAKMIPRDPGMTISAALKQVPDLKALSQSDPKVKQLLEISQKLEGLKRHTSVHAAGIVIVPTEGGKDITHYVPLAKGKEDVITTQFNDESLLKLGVLKMDFLGLRTLTVLNEAEKLVRERQDPEFDLNKITLKDINTYKLLTEAKTVGIFQLESSGMRDLLRKLKPTAFEDIIAVGALYRPGPMASGLLNDFVARKHSLSKVKFDHPRLEPILKETYGVIVYQEQVMLISRAIAGFSAGQADLLRKAMGKKMPEEITKLRNDFLQGAKKNGVEHHAADKIFTLIEHFGGYGFNKSHATAYGLVSYQTAYMKTNYPKEYMAALISSAIGHSRVNREEPSKMEEYIEDAQEMGIEILPPDVQSSGKLFTLMGIGNSAKICYGLLAVKNVGEGAVDEILKARENGPFLSFLDFCSRVDTRTVNKKVMESLIKAGAFDFCGESKEKVRAELFQTLEETMERAGKSREERLLGQESLFQEPEWNGNGTVQSNGNGTSHAAEWPEHELLSYEKEVLGFYFSGHPLAKYKEELRSFSTHSLSYLPENGTVRVAGMMSNVKRLVSKAKKAPYARFNLEDLEGEIECLVFPKTFPKLSGLLSANQMTVVSGRISQMQGKEDSASELIVDEVWPLESARTALIKKMILHVSTAGLEKDLVHKLKKLLGESPGNCDVEFVLHTPSHGNFKLVPGIKAGPNAELFQGLKSLLGDGSWKLVLR